MAWPESLLIVDDQMEIRQSVIQLFSVLDMRPSLVLEAKDAEEAIALYDQHHPQLTLVDVVLFGNSGFDVLRHIREQNEDAVVMMMTAFPQFDYAMEAIRARVDHFLVKPLSAQQLESALMDVMGHKSRRAGSADMSRSFYTQQLDRILRGEEGPMHLEKARRAAGIDALAGSEMQLACVRSSAPPAPEKIQAAYSALGGPCVSYLQPDGTLVLLTAFDKTGQDHASHLLSQVCREQLPDFWAGVSVCPRQTGLMEMYRRSAFALTYAGQRQMDDLPVIYERIDMGRYLISLCHASLLAAYDQGDEPRFIDAMDEMMILLRQHHAVAPAWDALNEMYAMEGMPPLRGEGSEPESLYRACVRHFQQYCAAGRFPPQALRLSAVREYLLKSGGALNHEALSSLASLSYGYLSELFRQYRGQSLNEYARALRLRRAAELLAGTACRVYEVARLTGFEGNKHFYGIFQKAYGQTPVQYHETQYGETEKAP